MCNTKKCVWSQIFEYLYFTFMLRNGTDFMCFLSCLYLHHKGEDVPQLVVVRNFSRSSSDSYCWLRGCDEEYDSRFLSLLFL